MSFLKSCFENTQKKSKIHFFLLRKSRGLVNRHCSSTITICLNSLSIKTEKLSIQMAHDRALHSAF